ncbi:serine hydrolase domain-containing protein [Paracoccus amoyensis]|uniref:serine hydrolase domain-containing protein n=1 Tax=Paracoccus amoyensis TaxID=2760093 RepID=UPI0031B59955
MVELHASVLTTNGSAASGPPDARFPYWSFTKTIIAICAMKLMQAGRLDLDATLPDQSFSMWELLRHDARLPDYGQLPDYHRAVAGGGLPWTAQDMLDRVATALPARTDGWTYSNIGYMFARDHLQHCADEVFGDMVQRLICRPLGLKTVRLATAQQDFAGLHWPEAANYNPAWVYHGCLIGNAAEAARILHALMSGELLAPSLTRKMLDALPVGGALQGRPWQSCGYGLGLMIGRMQGAGLAIGHTGGGPFSTNAIYHFPDMPNAPTVATFIHGTDEGAAEYQAVRLATGLR